MKHLFTIKCPAGTVCMYFVMKEYRKERGSFSREKKKFSFEGIVCTVCISSKQRNRVATAALPGR
jgi:hypothetical protein